MATKSASLTDRQAIILRHFLSFVPFPGGVIEDALAYPGLIAKNSHGTITKPTAKTACEKLVRMGILKKRRWGKGLRNLYYVNKDIETLVKLIEVFAINKHRRWRQPFVRWRYVQKQIDIKLVKHVFEKKKVEANAKGIDGQDELILPILALIKTSSSALAEFVVGGWKPYYKGSLKNYQIVSVDHILFRLMFLTITDLFYSERRLPYEGIVKDAWVNGGRDKQVLKNSLLALRLKNNQILHFDGGTDTTFWSYIGFPSEDRINPDNCRVNWWIEEPQNSKIKREGSVIQDSSEWREQKPNKIGYPEWSTTVIEGKDIPVINEIITYQPI